MQLTGKLLGNGDFKKGKIFAGFVIR